MKNKIGEIIKLLLQKRARHDRVVSLIAQTVWPKKMKKQQLKQSVDLGSITPKIIVSSFLVGVNLQK